MKQRIEGVLQWNVNCFPDTPRLTVTARLKLLGDMVTAKTPSIIALQESPAAARVQAALPPGFDVEDGSARLVTAYNTSVWQRVDRDDGTSRALGLALTHSAGLTALVWNIHAPILWHKPIEVEEFIRTQVRPALIRFRQKHPGTPDLVVGDFNLPPYSAGITMQSGLLANRSLVWVHSRYDAMQIVDRPLFNATWGIFGSLKPPLGTHYRVCEGGPWHIVDQAMMSPTLALTGMRQVHVIDRVGNVDLCARSQVRTPSRGVGSDHLPLYVQFRTA